MLTDEERAGDVYLPGLSPVFEGHVFGRPNRAINAGVINHHMQGAQFRRFRKKTGNATGVGNVAGNADKFLPRRQSRKEICLCLSNVGRGPGAETDIGAVGEKSFDDVSAETLAAASDKGVASGKFHGRPTVR